MNLLKHILLVVMLTAVSWSQVTVEIQNVTLTPVCSTPGVPMNYCTGSMTWLPNAGSLDIYMTNQAGCSYCTDDSYDNQDGCETYGDDGDGDASWEFDASIDEAACAAANGIWFGGEVKGFQFFMDGIDITDASGGSSDFMSIVFQPTGVVAFSTGVEVIPAGAGLLIQFSFSDIVGPDICFSENDCSSGACTNVFSDPNAIPIETVWGDCLCPDLLDGDSDGDLDDGVVDQCGVCGGSGPTTNFDCDGNCLVEMDCNGVCAGSAVLDECGVCGGSGPLTNFDCDGICLENCDTDCFGVLYGEGLVDDCYQCIDCSNYPFPLDDCTHHPAWNTSCTDCNGDLWGVAFYDACPDMGVCADGTSPDQATCESNSTWTSFSECSDALYDNQVDCEINDEIWARCVGGLTDEAEDGWDQNGNGSLESPITACFEDCDGGAYGTFPLYSYDDCGVCDNVPGNDCEVDCNGDWGGYAVIDNCGYCALGDSGQQPCTPDCNGNWDGVAELDDCGICSGGFSGHEANSEDLGCGCFQPGPTGCDNTCGSTLDYDCTYDANDNSTWAAACGGSSYKDNCDQCVGGDTGLDECEAGCDGVYSLSPLEDDECGICGGDGPPLGDCDCFGNVLDNCDNCGGGSYFTDSNGESCIQIEKISNPDHCDYLGGFWSEVDYCVILDYDCLYRGADDYCDCSYSVFDECGVCGIDLHEPGPTFGSGCCEAELDECSVCFGYGEIYECGCTPLEEGYCDCDMQMEIDCAGMCGGSAVEDECDACLLPECEECEPADCPENPATNPCPDGYEPGNSEWNLTCLDCNGIFNGPTQFDCLGDCGGSAVYDCRYGDTDGGPDGDGFDQSEIAVPNYCNGSFIDAGNLDECYSYNNTGEWVLNIGEDYDTLAECEAVEGYFWINAGKDACGVCDGDGPIYGLDDNCCEDDLDECGVCGMEGGVIIIGVEGPGLADSGNCDGDEGCAEFTHDKNACEDDGDDLTCYWGGWCDCSGNMIKDCDGECPNNPEYVGGEGIFGWDECGVCDGDGAIYGNNNCCQADTDACDFCFGPDGDSTTDDDILDGQPYASPEGVQDNGEIYCDCVGNVYDCTGECGGSLVGTGAYQCIGGNHDNQADCESSGNLWIKIGNDCTGNTCQGTDFSCIKCVTDDDSQVDPWESCDTAANGYEDDNGVWITGLGCDFVIGNNPGILISTVCPESCGAPCFADDQNPPNYCQEEEIDVCGLCHGIGVGENSCDCFDNIGNCAGDCPTYYIVNDDMIEDFSAITGNPGIWTINEDYEDITGNDLDGDGICDDEDNCISSGAPHLIYTNNSSITDTEIPSMCLDVCVKEEGSSGVGATESACNNILLCSPECEWFPTNTDLTEDECNGFSGDWIDATPNTFFGGYDLCGDCNGNGFSCGFEAVSGFKEISLSWNRPNMGGLADSLGEDMLDSLGLLNGMNFNDETDMNSSFYRTGDIATPEEICSEPPNSMPNDTTVIEYGLYSNLTPSVSISIDDVDFTEGTANLYMSNIPSCGYCEDPIYNNSVGASWQTQKKTCERVDQGNSTWVVDANLSEAECADVPSMDGTFDASLNTGGWWFDGSIGGLQFFMIGAKITDLLGGTAEEYFDILTFNSSTDCDADGTNDTGCNMVLATSMTGGSIPPSSDKVLLMSIEFVNFDAAGFCFVGMETPSSGNWSPPIASDMTGIPVLVDWGTCFCTDDNPPDDCGVCGGEGLDQGCGCGPEFKCELQPGACDCTARMPSETYAGGTLAGEDICWNGDPVCGVEFCTPDPDAVSYNVYRRTPNLPGGYILRENGLSLPQFTDADLGYEEPYCYLVSYFQDKNNNLQFDADEEYFLELDVGENVCGITDPLTLGCTYPSACNYDENANYYDGTGWWPAYGCGCSDEKGSAADYCGNCDVDITNDCTTDCFGAWGGDADVDVCGTCGGSNTDANDCCDGDAYLDNCDTCVGGDTLLEACVSDCNGEWGGEAVEDECGVCSGGNSDHDAGSDIDECGVCFGDNSTCADCAGIPNGDALEDECGTCDADPTNNCIEDCNGVWGGPLLGHGIFECYSIAGDSIATEIFFEGDSIATATACIDANNDSLYLYLWSEIGNDECGICDGIGPIEGFDCEGNVLSIINGLIPEEYNINNIYPNPFNPVTNIEFGLPENTYVKMVVYDIHGRQVATLVNSFQVAGYYSINWNANSNSSGVYFIRMMTDTFNQTEKVILMK